MLECLGVGYSVRLRVFSATEGIHDGDMMSLDG